LKEKQNQPALILQWRNLQQGLEAIWDIGKGKILHAKQLKQLQARVCQEP
jgi:hypothetical protein